jgi:hypothetical protein
MDLDDTVRERQPREADEYRLATITDVTYSTPHTTHIRRLQVRFPNGRERTYTPDEVIACTRADDHAALAEAFKATLRGLRDACRIAHDYDDQLSTDIIGLLVSIHSTVQTRLGVDLDPAHLDPPADTEGEATK